jgi:hypothetical protein
MGRSMPSAKTLTFLMALLTSLNLAGQQITEASAERVLDPSGAIVRPPALPQSRSKPA